MVAPKIAPASPRPIVAGVELGGTKCICTLATGPDGIIAQRTIPTEEPEITLSVIEQTLAGWWQEFGFAALGIASFGPVDLDPHSERFGSILATNKPGWSMTDVGARLAAPYDVPMGFDTDVNGAAMAEIRWGSGQGLSDFAYVTVGTGVGVGLIVHGRPTRGIGHSELGHLRVPKHSEDYWPSGCRFHPDCVEGMASGTAIKAALGTTHVSTIGPNHPVWDRVATALTGLFHALVCATGPRRIAIGGGVVGKQPHLLARLEPLLRESLNGYMPIPEGGYIVAPALGDLAGPLGPVALATEALESGGVRAAQTAA